jgi:hypothetical protein
MGKRDSVRKVEILVVWLDLGRSEDESVSFVAFIGKGLGREMKAGLIGKRDSARKVVSLEWLDLGRSEDARVSFAPGKDLGREMLKAGLIGRTERRRDDEDWEGLVACGSVKAVSRPDSGTCSSTAGIFGTGSLGPGRLVESIEDWTGAGAGAVGAS